MRLATHNVDTLGKYELRIKSRVNGALEEDEGSVSGQMEDNSA